VYHYARGSPVALPDDRRRGYALPSRGTARATLVGRMGKEGLAETLGHAASPRVLLPLALLTSAIYRRRPGAARVAVATALAVAVTEASKPLVHRPRPRWFGSERRRSFPSGHSSASTAYLLATALTARREHRTPALLLALAGIAGVDATRVVAHEHWISDVLAGDVVGTLSVAAAEAVIGRLSRMHR
jgi:membrane-associated phospholipid phosphatase